jgi:DNA-binding transcriptional LysR family regulator
MERFVTMHLKRRDVTMQNTHMVSYHEAAKIYTKLGFGITFLDYFACTEKDKEELNVIPMSAYFPQREFMAVELRGRESSLAQEAFLRFLHRKGLKPEKPQNAYDSSECEATSQQSGKKRMVKAVRPRTASQGLSD